MNEGDKCKVTRGSAEIQWCAKERIAVIRYAENANLTAPDGRFLADSLQGWIGDEREPFSVLSFSREIRGTDAAYRTIASAFFRKHRDTVHLALMDASFVLTVVSEMFRVGSGIPLKTFSDETAARVWLATSRGGR